MPATELPKTGGDIEPVPDLFFTAEQQRFLHANFDTIKALLQDGVTQDITTAGGTLVFRHGILIDVT